MRLATREEAREILSRPDISHAYENIEEILSHNAIIFPYVERVGVFPTSLMTGWAVIHPAIIKEARGWRAAQAGKEVVNWLFENFKKPVVTKIAKENMPARVFCRVCGGEPFCTNQNYVYYVLRSK